jgi:hypothetical protein
MKIFIVALLATTASTAHGRKLNAADLLEARWKMEEPGITYNAADNLFTLDFNTASEANTNAGMTEQFYDINCQDDGTNSYVEYEITSGIMNAAGTGLPEMVMTPGEGVIGATPELKFKIDTQILANDPKIYTVITQTMADNANLPWTNDDVGKGVMQLCVRSNLGYPEYSQWTAIDTTNIPNPPFGVLLTECQGDCDAWAVPSECAPGLTCQDRSSSSDPDPPGCFGSAVDDWDYCVKDEYVGPGAITPEIPNQEVNFIESLITIKYDLTAGFDVDAFSVEPKERVETTAAKETYALEAYLCDPDATPLEVLTTPARSRPFAITDYDPVTGSDAYNQGALITVCVAPDGPTYADGIRLNGLTDFTWTRDSPLTNQEAIFGSAASLNGLTSYISTNCVMSPWCHFSSILFADFYISAGEVYGSGNAALTFQTRRRLGEAVDEDSRQLQEEDASSPFDLAVSVQVTDEGPGALKTAGGASFGTSALASAVALLAAALLA